MSKKEFKGFDDYVEIFRGGKQVDSSGNSHDGDTMIDQAVASFQAETHQPPLVVGHPKDNEPAYGWVKGLQTKTVNGVKTLLAKFEEVVPEFEELVAAGRYKKRSASFYPDGRLRHVGFLGAVPPAVKGLADLKFDDGEGEQLTFDFYDYKTGVIARIMGRMREFLIEKEGVETADRVIPNWDVDTLKEEAVREDVEEPALYTEQKPQEDTLEPKTQNFTEADIEAAKEAGKEAAAAEFAEQESTRKKAETKTAIKDFCDQGINKGILLPAWVDGGIKEFMEGLDSEETISFSEDNKQTSLAWFQDFMEKLPQSVNFKEIATRQDLPDNENADDIAKRAREFKEAEEKLGRTISITEAVVHVTKG
ncbi:MAG: hypothetical protein KJ804_09115 [Proteobacteria bacterium]|nr:hypothetical protein [Pseudomonadota bacterium]MBU1058459.1 hypothetical protein [Pseudomonadota bacterium]